MSKIASPQFEDYQKDYPNLFRTYPRSGFYLPIGWVVLVKSLSFVLDWHISQLPEDIKLRVQCAQLKQKFGALRLYMTAEDEYIHGAISVAQNMSTHICEICGNPGSLRDENYWIETLCDEHFKNEVHNE